MEAPRKRSYLLRWMRLPAKIAQLFPQLVERSRQVLFYAENFAQDKALEAAAEYAQVADSIQDRILAYRRERLKIADGAVTYLSQARVR